MRAITKVSDITYQDLAEYCRLDELSQSDINMLNNQLAVAKAYIMQYTGRTAEELDTYGDVVIVVFVLCQDMWDNRSLYVERTYMNQLVESILSMHQVNLL